jgi:hypothetical protein
MKTKLRLPRPGGADAVFFGAALAALAVVLLAFQHVPGLSPSTFVTLSNSGYAQCIANGWAAGQIGCGDDIGYPAGGVRVFGLPVNMVSALLGIDGGVSLLDAHAVDAFLTATAFVGAAAFFGLLFSNRWLGLLGATLYMAAPIVSGQGGYATLRLGYALIPTYLMIDALLLRLPSSAWPGRVSIILIVIVARSFALLNDGYSFLMSSGIAAALFAVSLVSRRSRTAAAWAIPIYATACGLAYALYLVVVPNAQAGLGVMPIDFFRGQGVDLYSLLVPSAQFWLFDSLDWTLKVRPVAAYGDGSNLAFNFLGYVALGCAVGLAIMVATRRAALSATVTAVLLSGLVAFVLSLGPSLKFKSWDPGRIGQVSGFNAYLMPPDKAVLALGTDWIYQSIPGVRNIRVLARWQNVVHFGLVLCVLVVVAVFIRQGRTRIAAVLAALALVEMMPNLPALVPDGRARWREAVAIDRHYLGELLSLTESRERVLLLQLHAGAERNHFLADFFCPHALLRCYNIGGDKAAEIVSDRWPVEVHQLMAGRAVEASLASLFAQRELDVAVVPLFDLRRLAYGRVAGQVDERAVRARIARLASSQNYEVQHGVYFATLRPEVSAQRAMQCGLVCWKDWREVRGEGVVEGWGPRAARAGLSFNRQANGRSALWVKVAADPDEFLIAFGGVPLPTASGGGVVSAQMSAGQERQLKAGKRYPVDLLNTKEQYSIRLGYFSVEH